MESEQGGRLWPMHLLPVLYTRIAIIIFMPLIVISTTTSKVLAIVYISPYREPSTDFRQELCVDFYFLEGLWKSLIQSVSAHFAWCMCWNVGVALQVGVSTILSTSCELRRQTYFAGSVYIPMPLC